MQNIIETPAIQSPCSLLWDEYALITDKSRDLLESGVAADESEALEMASLDYEMLEFEFEDFLETFDGILKDISPQGLFFVEGRNMGWRHLSGSLDFAAHNARSFIAMAFPRTTEWSLRGVFDRGAKILTYTLYHHDAPAGEFYTVRADDKNY